MIKYFYFRIQPQCPDNISRLFLTVDLSNEGRLCLYHCKTLITLHSYFSLLFIWLRSETPYIFVYIWNFRQTWILLNLVHDIYIMIRLIHKNITGFIQYNIPTLVNVISNHIVEYKRGAPGAFCIARCANVQMLRIWCLCIVDCTNC